MEAERKKKKGGIAVNLTGTTFICVSHFFYAFLCLCCLWTHVRSLGIEFSLLEQQFGSLEPFVSVLSHSELDLYSVYFFGFLTL